MIADAPILFYGVAGFAVFFVALAKAGFGGMIGSLGMPLVAAVSDIPTAISILLPHCSTHLHVELVPVLCLGHPVHIVSHLTRKGGHGGPSLS